MKKYVLLVLVVCCSTFKVQGQIRALNSSEIMSEASSSDTVYIINFWATWCPPCVQELPEFNVLNEQYAGKKVKILMVSLDFKESFPQKLELFLKRKRLVPEVAWLSETDPNIFVPRIDESWQGSIPATLIIKPGKGRKFIEGQISASQVAGFVDGIITR